ncbi:Protein of unknown function (DUF3000) [Haloactinopolyspora alba]|uniref:DUF3000 family protein n=1 Tax=Haloactinopolyspora alba TaxID=648780 RepID=A0A2P8E2P4_9ACTN|nr:Protein of unknown function (DUF3000) [Haloactinopolyspora alba]
MSGVFAHAVETLHSAQFRPEVHLEETPAPKRLAPHTHALSADVFVESDDDDPTATGRLVLLYDPAGQEAWHGEFRLVTYVRASLELEMGSDPLLPAVGWSWMIDALTNRSAPFTAPSGTVTRVSSEGFGGMADETATAEIEIRASWTPLDGELMPHALAWGDALTTAAGLVPLPTGVVAIPQKRTRRSR